MGDQFGSFKSIASLTFSYKLTDFLFFSLQIRSISFPVKSWHWENPRCSMCFLPPLYADFWYLLMGLVLCFVLIFCMTGSARKNSRLRMRNVCCLLRQLVSNSRLVSFHPSRYSVLPSLRFSIPTDPRCGPISRRAGPVSWTERNGERSRNGGRDTRERCDSAEEC